MLNTTRLAAALALVSLTIAGCQIAKFEAGLAKFEAKAAPVIANACARFRQAEASPLVQIAIAGGTLAANAATGGIAGPAVAAIRSYGDQFCANGPPAGDSTTAQQQADWLDGKITGVLVAAVGK